MYTMQCIEKPLIQWSFAFNANVGHFRLDYISAKEHAQNADILFHWTATKSGIQCQNQMKLLMVIVSFEFLRFTITTGTPSQKKAPNFNFGIETLAIIHFSFKMVNTKIKPFGHYCAMSEWGGGKNYRLGLGLHLCLSDSWLVSFHEI